MVDYAKQPSGSTYRVRNQPHRRFYLDGCTYHVFHTHAHKQTQLVHST